MKVSKRNILELPQSQQSVWTGTENKAVTISAVMSLAYLLHLKIIDGVSRPELDSVG